MKRYYLSDGARLSIRSLTVTVQDGKATLPDLASPSGDTTLEWFDGEEHHPVQHDERGAYVEVPDPVYDELTGAAILYHFDVGDSSDGPAGYCARIRGTSREDALERLKAILPDAVAADPYGDLRHDEYIEFYPNPNALTLDNVTAETTPIRNPAANG